MYSKAEVIYRIGEERWDEFELFMMGRETELDEYGFDEYYVGDILEFMGQQSML